ncbi:MAG TPA: hypothetical protein VK211_13540 [Kamptonema sp.]|nr:hypothetical protein [Kamptonema sp.]
MLPTFSQAHLQKQLTHSHLMLLTILPCIIQFKQVRRERLARVFPIRTEAAYRAQLKLQKQGLMHDLLTGKVLIKDADKFTTASDKVQLVVGFSPIK